jgi:uncharacterized damage-inducible protein DinB
MYGEVWTKAKILHVLDMYQTNHRGQLTVIMLLIGKSVTSVYGPTREGWAVFGMPAMD